jgi:hypothetical protein
MIWHMICSHMIVAYDMLFEHMKSRVRGWLVTVSSFRAFQYMSSMMAEGRLKAHLAPLHSIEGGLSVLSTCLLGPEGDSLFVFRQPLLLNVVQGSIIWSLKFSRSLVTQLNKWMVCWTVLMRTQWLPYLSAFWAILTTSALNRTHWRCNTS